MQNLIRSANGVVDDKNGGRLSDEKLFELCKRYGGNVLFWRRKFLGLLPEVAKRKLYEKKGFSSIFEFAKKLAGISEEQVRMVLNLERRFEDKKELHELLVEGKVSVNKLSRIVSVATRENEGFWAQQVRVLPQSAVNTLVKDVNVAKIGDQNSLFEPKNEAKSLYVQTSDSFILADDVMAELNKLNKKGIDVNELLRKLLEKRKREIEEEKEEIAEKMKEREAGTMNSIEVAEKMAGRLAKSLIEAIGDDVIVQSLTKTELGGRYVPRKIQKIIKKEFGTKCAVPTCNKLAEHLHHTLPFALSQNHDPRYLMPLCKEHHIIAHSVDQKFQSVRRMVT